MIDYTLILATNYPTARWALAGDSYDGLTWFSDTQKPTQAELDALWESTQAAQIAKQEAKQAAQDSATAKLKKLGLTDDEISALKGTL
jgi:hypothetical protein